MREFCTNESKKLKKINKYNYKNLFQTLGGPKRS